MSGYQQSAGLVSILMSLRTAKNVRTTDNWTDLASCVAQAATCNLSGCTPEETARGFSTLCKNTYCRLQCHWAGVYDLHEWWIPRAVLLTGYHPCPYMCTSIVALHNMQCQQHSEEIDLDIPVYAGSVLIDNCKASNCFVVDSSCTRVQLNREPQPHFWSFFPRILHSILLLVLHIYLEIPLWRGAVTEDT